MMGVGALAELALAQMPHSLVNTLVDSALPSRPTLIRDLWDCDEYGRFYPGAGYHAIR